jgi:sodium-dependent phosphate cotransporter
MASTQESAEPAATGGPQWLVWIFVAALVYPLLVGVGVVGAAFKWFLGGSDGAQAIFAFAGNPLAGGVGKRRV